MSQPGLPTDSTFLDVACDVVIRFRGHGSYGDEAGALKAFGRRAPGFEAPAYREAFTLLVALYDRAVDALTRHQVAGPIGRVARIEDIDVEGCIAELDVEAPDVGRREKEVILNWVIYWHYLR